MSYVTLLHNIGELKRSSWKWPFWPLWPLHDLWGQTVDNFCNTHPLVILTNFGQNPIKHVEEETNCEKKKEEEERNRKIEIS